MKNNKLTLKALDQKIDALLASKTSPKSGSKPVTETHKSSVAHDIKNSYIQNLHMKSSMFMLWLLSWVIFYAHKIPFIGKITTFLSLWYGRTTIWKVLVKIRKVFIVFNSIIGMYIVFKTTGFGFDNILAGLTGMGHTYLEIIINFSKRLFNWFYELLDNKIVPNVPGTPPNTPPTRGDHSFKWYPRGLVNTGYDPVSNPIISDKPFSLREIYTKGGINVSVNTTPWYRDFSTWLWIGGMTAGMAGIGYLAYLGYAYYTGSNIDPTAFSPTDGSITPTQGSKGVLHTVTTSLSNGLSKMNPYNWFMSSNNTDAAKAAFMDAQSHVQTMNRDYYPFTTIDPYASWFDRMRISWFGENRAEMLQRIKDEATAMMEYNSHVGTSGLTSGTVTPHMGSVGLGLRTVSGSGITDAIVAGTSGNEVWDKLGSLPNTPKITPVAPLSPIEDLDASNWTNYVASKEVSFVGLNRNTHGLSQIMVNINK